MAGYSGFSMSNNAVEAYGSGLLPASKIKGIPAPLIKKYCWAGEWHHSSKNFNRVDFFDPAEVLATFGIVESDDYPADPDAVEALAEHKAPKAPSAGVLARIEWIEWGGTMKHPVATKRNEVGRVTVTGATATIEIPGQQSFQKRLTTNGFSFTEIKKEEK